MLGRADAWSAAAQGSCLSKAKEHHAELAALPDGFALLGECGRSLAGILGREDGAGDLALSRPALLLAPVDGLLDDLLRGDHRQRSVLDDLPRQLDGRLQRRAGFGKAVDDPDLLGALGAD